MLSLINQREINVVLDSIIKWLDNYNLIFFNCNKESIENNNNNNNGWTKQNNLVIKQYKYLEKII